MAHKTDKTKKDKAKKGKPEQSKPWGGRISVSTDDFVEKFTQSVY